MLKLDKLLANYSLDQIDGICGIRKLKLRRTSKLNLYITPGEIFHRNMGFDLYNKSNNDIVKKIQIYKNGNFRNPCNIIKQHAVKAGYYNDIDSPLKDWYLHLDYNCKPYLPDEFEILLSRYNRHIN
jgi:hypothetical protein